MLGNHIWHTENNLSRMEMGSTDAFDKLTFIICMAMYQVTCFTCSFFYQNSVPESGLCVFRNTAMF